MPLSSLTCHQCNSWTKSRGGHKTDILSQLRSQHPPADTTSRGAAANQSTKRPPLPVNEAPYFPAWKAFTTFDVITQIDKWAELSVTLLVFGGSATGTSSVLIISTPWLWGEKTSLLREQRNLAGGVSSSVSLLRCVCVYMGGGWGV